MIVICLGVMPEAGATHVIGGDITYRCLGNDQYEIRLRLRRDCLLGAPGTEFDDPASIGVYDAVQDTLVGVLLTPVRGDDTLNVTLISDCTIAGNDVCVQETQYVDTLTLPYLETGYVIVYQRCCRNQTLQNVVDPTNTGMTIATTISGPAQLEQNNSPVFGPFPPIYRCVNEPVAFDFSATDLEGDSLVYELFTPFQGANEAFPKPPVPPAPPYDTVIWQAPFSLTNIMGGPDPFRIDRQTGLLTGTPPLIGQFLIGVRVKAYRDGQLISEITREWQYNVRACREVPEANFAASDFLNCDTLHVDFMHTSQFSDQFYWIFDYGNPDSEVSFEEHPSFMFPHEGFYDVALIVNDIDSICFDTIIQTVGVFESELFADFDLLVPDCSNEIVLTPVDLSGEPNPDYDVVGWQWVISYPGVMDTQYVQEPEFLINTNTDDITLSLTVTSSNGCESDIDIEIFDVNIIAVPFDADVLNVCNGSSITLVEGDPEFEYTWSPTESLDLTNPWSPIASPTENTTYYVTVTDGICTIIDSVDVEIVPMPIVDIPDIDTSCFGAPTVINPGGDPNYTYLWSPAGLLNDPTLPNPIADVKSTTTFYVTITDKGGEQCSVVDSVIVFVPPDVVLGAPNDTAYCDSPPITLTATGSGLEYIWYGPMGEIIGNGPQVTVQPEVETTYILEGTDIFGCEVQQNITLTPTYFNYTLSEEPVLCAGEVSTLSVTDLNGQNLSFVWTPLEGIIGGNTQSTIVIQPGENVTYSVVITNDDLGCISEEEFEVIVGSFNPEDLEIYLQEDTITLGEYFILSTNQDPNLFYFWDGPGIDNPNLPEIMALPGNSGFYSYAVTVTNMYGCELMGVISNAIVMDPRCNADEIFVPDAFSPNGDGQNDVLYVYGNFIESMELHIYNRWGEEVFVTRDQGSGWDGMFEGKEAEPGVYGYYLQAECLPDKSYFTKGNITLLK